jgi:hypothetical protein
VSGAFPSPLRRRAITAVRLYDRDAARRLVQLESGPRRQNLRIVDRQQGQAGKLGPGFHGQELNLDVVRRVLVSTRNSGQKRRNVIG